MRLKIPSGKSRRGKEGGRNTFGLVFWKGHQTAREVFPALGRDWRDQPNFGVVNRGFMPGMSKSFVG